MNVYIFTFKNNDDESMAVVNKQSTWPKSNTYTQ